MSPPLPPSPPSGPPNSTNFSRRNETAPGPPAPERTKILAWSRKCIGAGLSEAGRKGNLLPSPRPRATLFTPIMPNGNLSCGAYWRAHDQERRVGSIGRILRAGGNSAQEEPRPQTSRAEGLIEEFETSGKGWFWETG